MYELMKRLVDALEGLFTATVLSGGDLSNEDLAKTANFTLQNVRWKDTLSRPEPKKHPIEEAYLQAACANSGPDASSAHTVAQALMAVTDQLEWRASSKCRDDGPDVEILSRNFAIATIIGEGGPLKSDKVSAGFSLQAPDTYYPPHAHYAEESYWIIGGDADWRVGRKAWFAVQPGDSIYHESEARHAMQTNEQPLLTVWLWTSHLDSEVVIVRG
ncbi:MAG: cupin domain-containing protein [Proteobacteria bacterium]|nr:cupin domain-containing protein [Pseudomonadota bacterium]